MGKKFGKKEGIVFGEGPFLEDEQERRGRSLAALFLS
jgi:hypothetical protein